MIHFLFGGIGYVPGITLVTARFRGLSSVRVCVAKQQRETIPYRRKQQTLMK